MGPRVQRSAQTINLHQRPGSHSPDQLNKAIRANLTTPLVIFRGMKG